MEECITPRDPSEEEGGSRPEASLELESMRHLSQNRSQTALKHVGVRCGSWAHCSVGGAPN